MSETEDKLIDAQKKAQLLFSEIEKRQLIHADITEKEVNTEIYDLAFELFGVKKYWHKRIVRAGKNTLYPYEYNPPDLIIKHDDIVFVDFGPIFESWEADFGRTFVLGNDPLKKKMQSDISEAWHLGKTYFDNRLDITGKELYEFMTSLAAKFGWEFGQVHCGHLIGEFPHERIQGNKIIFMVKTLKG